MRWPTTGTSGSAPASATGRRLVGWFPRCGQRTGMVRPEVPRVIQSLPHIELELEARLNGPSGLLAIGIVVRLVQSTTHVSLLLPERTTAPPPAAHPGASVVGPNSMIAHRGRGAMGFLAASAHWKRCDPVAARRLPPSRLGDRRSPVAPTVEFPCALAGNPGGCGAGGQGGQAATASNTAIPQADYQSQQTSAGDAPPLRFLPWTNFRWCLLPAQPLTQTLTYVVHVSRYCTGYRGLNPRACEWLGIPEATSLGRAPRECPAWTSGHFLRFADKLHTRPQAFLRGRTCVGIGTTGTTGTATTSRGSREWKASHEALVQVNGGERLWRTTTAGALPYHHLGSRFAKPGDIGLVWQDRDIGLRLRRLRGRHCSRRFICFVQSSATLSPPTNCATVYRGSSLYSERTTRATSP